MMTSTTPESKEGKRKGKIRLWAVLVWLAVWQPVSMWIGQEILLVSPVTVVCTVVKLAATAEFWLSIASSMIRIVGGFLLLPQRFQHRRNGDVSAGSGRTAGGMDPEKVGG